MHFNMKSKGDSHARTAYAERNGDYFMGRALDREFRASPPQERTLLPERRKTSVTRTVQVPLRLSTIAKSGLRARLYGLNGTRTRDTSRDIVDELGKMVRPGWRWLSLYEVFRLNDLDQVRVSA